jgi:NAD-dependent deacetylase
VVLFGEPLPQPAIQQALALARQADVMLVVGSSLVVRPAADIPLVALRSGAQLVVINPDPTPLDDLAAIVIRGKSGEVLPEIVELIGG